MDVQALRGMRKLAVVGHTEWVEFLRVPHLPQPGQILHADALLAQPAGGGAVAAVQLARLTGEAHFITALGRDVLGEQALERLNALGLKVSVVWRDQPTRRAITFIDADGERSITVVGQRLSPIASDPLPWDELQECDGVYVTATDEAGLQLARQAAVLTATPRTGLAVIEQSGIRLDALIGSGRDPGEKVPSGCLSQAPKVRIATEGELGGWSEPGGRFKAISRGQPQGDTYGAGDCFAAGVTAGLAAEMSISDAINLGCRCGAHCIDGVGAYAAMMEGI